MTEELAGGGFVGELGNRRRLRKMIRHFPALLRKRVTRWRLIVAGVAFLGVVLWLLVAASSISTYSSTVLFTDSGGIGIPPPFENLDFGDVPRGLPMHRNVTLDNNGKLDTYVLVFTWGGIRDFLSVDDAFFNMSPGETRNMEFSVQAPSNADAKRYSGRVWVVRLPWWWPF
jgi:hypothetical protein